MPVKTEKVEKMPAWAFQDGLPKPEYSLPLRRKLSDGTEVLHLFEPDIKSIRRATKLLVMDGEEPTPDSGFAFGCALISSVINVPEGIVEELPASTFKEAMAYLQSFS